MKIHRGVRLLIVWYLGLMVGTRGEGSSYAQAPLPHQDVLVSSIPVELKAWLGETAAPPLPPGSYAASQLAAVLPPHAAQLLATEATNGTTPALDVVATRVYKVPISDHVHQLAANGDLDDTTRCGRELPFPGLAPSTERAGLKAIWNLLCRNRGGSFEYLAHNLRGSGPNPHRLFVINGRYDFSPQGFGLHALLLSPNETKGNEMMAWLPWERAQAERFYMYAVEARRARAGSTSARGDKMMGTSFTLEHGFGWEGQYYVYDWVLLGERPVLAVLDSRHTFPQYLPVNHWFPEDQWMLRPAFLVVGKRAHKAAGSGYVALWLDTATFEPLWTVFYTEAGIAQDMAGLTYKWRAESQHHVLLGESVVELDAHGVPERGTVFEAPFCSVVHHPDRHADSADFSGQALGTIPFRWSRRPAGCE